MNFDDIMAEAEAELGSEPGELAGTFPPGFAQSLGYTNEPDDDHRFNPDYCGKCPQGRCEMDPDA